MELLVLGLVAGISFASYALWHKGRKDERDDPGADRKRLLPAVDRSPTTLQVGDVVQHLGSDYLVEGVVTLSEDGRGARLYRLFEDAGERFLYAKAGGSDPLLLAPVMVPIEGDPPEILAHGGASYRQTSRVQASAIRVGQLGARKHADRVRVFEYAGPGPQRLLLVDWGDRVESFAGERVLASALEILPAR
ncbi:MAG: hypothetical protein JWN44_6472 [Myxococcales bacterium]|nr:hypothetical protein [Myxococcales bacterium]